MSRLLPFILCALLAGYCLATRCIAQPDPAPPVLQDIAFRGLEHLSPEMLARISQAAPKTQIGQPLNHEAFDGEKRALLEFGWFASVDASTEDIEGGVRLVFIFKENPTLLQVDCTGMKQLALGKQQQVTELTRALQNLPFNTTAARAVIDTIQAFGDVERCTYIMTPLNGGARLAFNVIEAPVITAIAFEGNTGISSDELQKILNIKPGDVFNRKDIAPNTLAIEKAFADKGYTESRVTDIKITEKNTLAFTIHEPTIAEIHIEGNKKTPEATIRAALTIKVGDVYNVNALRQSLKNLDNLQLFRDVSANPEPGKTPGTLNITFKVVER